MKAVISLILLSSMSLVQAQTAAPQAQSIPIASGSGVKLTAEEARVNGEVNKLGAEVARLFREGKYDEAFKLARDAFEIAKDAKLFDKGVAYTTISNLAELYLVKNKLSDAADLFARAAAVAEKGVGKRESAIVAKLIERAAYAEGKLNNFKNAERLFLDALALRAKIHGAHSAEFVNLLSTVAEFYRYNEKYDNAEQFFQSAVTISDQIFKPESKEYGRAFERYECFASQVPGLKLDDKYSKNFSAFSDARIIKYSRSESNEKVLPGGVVRAGVLNDKATNLVKPSYPVDETRSVRVGGVVRVRVLIDETGKVIEAETVCGYDIFAREAERAARESSFPPTLLSGAAVKLRGVIVYNFMPPL